jgi:hypothetical protein
MGTPAHLGSAGGEPSKIHVHRGQVGLCKWEEHLSPCSERYEYHEMPAEKVGTMDIRNRKKSSAALPRSGIGGPGLQRLLMGLSWQPTSVGPA